MIEPSSELTASCAPSGDQANLDKKLSSLVKLITLVSVSSFGSQMRITPLRPAAARWVPWGEKTSALTSALGASSDQSKRPEVTS